MPDDRAMRAEPIPVARHSGITVEEFYRMAEDGRLPNDRRFELLNGVIFEMPPMGPSHADIVTFLIERLSDLRQGRYSVRAGLPVRLDGSSEPQPDIAVVQPRRYGGEHPAPADVILVIEVASSSLRFDSTEKLSAYAHAGVPAYWIVDVTRRAIVCYDSPDSGEYASVTQYTAGSIHVPGLPDASIALEDLFALP